MKIILSRKGFDSDNGGYPSPILPDGTLISLPIPSYGDNTRFSDLRLNKHDSYFDLMKQLKPKIKRGEEKVILRKSTKCHLDPDIYPSILQRNRDWRAIFGPSGSAQTHLNNQGVSEGDLFLFFGWFRETILDDDIYMFDRHAPDLHVIFGYLQIDKIYQGKEIIDLPNWTKYHSHVIRQERNHMSTNTIYVAKRKLTWDKTTPGYGPLKYTKDVILTKKGYTRSRWDLPKFFRKVKISYHEKKPWNAEGYFQSVGKGQEFVIEDNDEVQNWGKLLIENNLSTI